MLCKTTAYPKETASYEGKSTASPWPSPDASPDIPGGGKGGDSLHARALGDLEIAVFKVIALPTRFVESAIAASVLLAALNNPYPLVTSRCWLVVFGFDLVHGLGFASMRLDLGLPTRSPALALPAFNLGVEAGQLAIVAAFLPLAHGVCHTMLYSHIVFQGRLACDHAGGDRVTLGAGAQPQAPVNAGVLHLDETTKWNP